MKKLEIAIEAAKREAIYEVWAEYDSLRRLLYEIEEQMLYLLFDEEAKETLASAKERVKKLRESPEIQLREKEKRRKELERELELLRR